MSTAISTSTKDKNINFSSQSILSNNSNWHTTKGNITYGNTIVMGDNSKCKVNIPIGKKVNYLKLKCEVTADDHTLSTDNFHLVSISYKINYADNKRTVDSYYPKYKFEDGYRDNFTTVRCNSEEIESIDVTLTNNEDEEIKVLATGLYTAIEGMSEEDVDNHVIDNFDRYMDDYKDRYGTFIEARNDDPPVSELYAGRIWLREDLIV